MTEAGWAYILQEDDAPSAICERKKMKQHPSYKKALVAEKHPHGRGEDPAARQRLTVPILPFSKIDEMGSGMYKGKPKRPTEANSGDQPESGGATPTRTLQSKGGSCDG